MLSLHRFLDLSASTRCYGTLITEHDLGILENTVMLDHSKECASLLAKIMVHYGFDGWLVNIESPLAGGAGISSSH